MSEVTATATNKASSGVGNELWTSSLRPNLQGLLVLVKDLGESQEEMSTERSPTQVTKINQDILQKSTVRDDEIFKISQIISDADTELGDKEMSAAVRLLSSMDLAQPEIISTLCRFTALPTPEMMDTWLGAIERRTLQVIAAHTNKSKEGVSKATSVTGGSLSRREEIKSLIELYVFAEAYQVAIDKSEGDMYKDRYTSQQSQDRVASFRKYQQRLRNLN